jgi:hypothetical protein
MNKKAMTAMIAVSLITLLVSAGVLLFVSQSQNELVSESLAQESCKLFTNLKASTSIDDLAQVTSLLNKGCIKEDLSIESTEEEVVFSSVSESMLRCWQRFGKGETDFLSKYDTDGQWCFTCARVQFDDVNTNDEYNFNDLVKWTQTEKVEENEDSEEEVLTYYDSMTMKYVDEDNGLEQDLASALEEFKEVIEGDGELATNEDAQEVLYEINEQYQGYLDLKLKDFSSDDTMYIVYRYDRWEKGLTELTGDVVSDVIENTIYSGLATYAATAVLTGGISLVTAPVKIANVVSKVAKLKKLVSLSEKMGKLIKVSGKLRKTNSALKKVDELEDVGEAVKKGASIGSKLRQGTTGGVVGGTALATGISAVNYNDHQIQYIDLLTQEQYYRQCGTLPPGEFREVVED